MNNTTKTTLTKKDYDEAYEKGEPLISDEEYDKKFNRASGLNDTDSHWPKIKLKEVMSSLPEVKAFDDKGITTFNDIKKWWKDNKISSVTMTWKYDGISIGNYYDQKLIYGASRGDGKTGDNRTSNVLKMQNLKTTVEYTGQLRAEGCILNKDLESTGYKNARNGAAGAFMNLEGEKCNKITLLYHNMTPIEDMSFEHEKFEWLDNNFDYVEHCVVNSVEELINQYNIMLETRESLPYEVDGVVITVDSFEKQKQMGFTPSGYPKYSIKFKFPYRTAVTVVEDIVWQNGKQGTLNPVAILKPIDLGGVTVRRASLHNVDQLNLKRVYVGDRVIISRRGDVIPQIEKSLESRTEYKTPLPTSCPDCSHKVQVIDAELICTNSDCNSRKLGDLNNWIEKLKDYFKFKHLGEERIQQLFDMNIVKDVSDLYDIKLVDIVNKLPNVKEKSGKNILSFQKYTEMPLWLFLGSLNISKLGRSLFKIITESYDTLESLKKASVKDLSGIYGIGEDRAKAVIEGLAIRDNLINKLLKKITIISESKLKSSSALEGMSFCITGTLSRPRSEIESDIVENSGVIKGVSSKLNYLVAGANAGSKEVKAQKLGIKIISEDELLKMLTN